MITYNPRLKFTSPLAILRLRILLVGLAQNFRLRYLAAEFGVTTMRACFFRCSQRSAPYFAWAQRSPGALQWVTPPPLVLKSAKNCFDRTGGIDASEALIEALILVGKFLVIDPKQVKQRGLEVADVDGILDDVV
jgi:hypothetical protein